MSKKNDDPLLSIFKHKTNKEYVEEIESIPNIKNFFIYLTNENIKDESKIFVIDNLTKIFKKNRYVSTYFASYENKSIYLYLFDMFLKEKSSNELKTSIMKLITELISALETGKNIYEYLFQKLSLIYRSEKYEAPEKIFNILQLINCILGDNEKVVKPHNFYSFCGNGKLVVDLTDKEKVLKFGYCFTFLLNFKIGICSLFEGTENPRTSNLININFSNNSSLSFNLQSPGILLIKETKENMVKVLPPGEWINLLVTIVIDDEDLMHVYCFVNGENNLTSTKIKTKLKKSEDSIKSLEFFNNFYGEVTSIAMFSQKEKANPGVLSSTFLVFFKKFIQGIWKKKKINTFTDFLKKINSYEQTSLNDTITSKSESEPANLPLINDLVFLYTPLTYLSCNDNNNKIIDDYLGNYQLLIKDQNNSIINNRNECYQKKLSLVCSLSNFFPIPEMLLLHPYLLTEQNFQSYLKIIYNIFNDRNFNIMSTKDCSFISVLSLFLERYPNNIYTEKILDEFINIGKILLRNNEELNHIYFKNILLNEKILSKYPENLQIKFWNHIMKFCQSDSSQMESLFNMNRICLILRFYDRNKYNEMCCSEHLNMIKSEFNESTKIMEPNMNNKLANISGIIDIIVNFQEPSWLLSLFKLLTLDLSPCLTKFITNTLLKGIKKHIQNKDFKWIEEFMKKLIQEKYDVIIINTFVHSLFDVRINLLGLIYQIHIILHYFKRKEDTELLYNILNHYLLPQKMFYVEMKENDEDYKVDKKKNKNTINDKTKNKTNEDNINVLIIKDEYYKIYLEKIHTLLSIWMFDDKKIENDVSFHSTKDFENAVIQDSEILEIVFEVVKQIDSVAFIIGLFESLNFALKTPNNADLMLYNKKILNKLLDLLFKIFVEKETEKDSDKDRCFVIGKTLISSIYMNSLIYREYNLESVYPINEIESIFLWGNKIRTINEIDEEKKDNNKYLFIFIDELFTELLFQFKIRNNTKMKSKEIYSAKENFKKFYYCNNYVILINKLFLFSFQYHWDEILSKENGFSSLMLTKKEYGFNDIFFNSMRIDESKAASLSYYWRDYQYFHEIYFRISYLWQNENVYKDYDKKKMKGLSKIKKYEDIVQNIILNKKRKNIFIKELEFLCHSSDNVKSIEQMAVDNGNYENVISLIKMIQIWLISILYLTSNKKNENELSKWLKEFKYFLIFIIISSSNIIIEENVVGSEELYKKIHQECLYVIYNSLLFLKQISISSAVCKEKLEKVFYRAVLLCFIIVKFQYAYLKKHKIKRKLGIGTKHPLNDLSNSAVFLLFNEYVKEKNKDKNNFFTLEALEKLFKDNLCEKNIIAFTNENLWKDNFTNNKILNDLLMNNYFGLNEYKDIVEDRIRKVKIDQGKIIIFDYDYYKKEIINLLPLYEEELFKYSNNSLERFIIKKNTYKSIKKNLFAWKGFWSDRSLFFPSENTNTDLDNKTTTSINNNNKLKYKLINHYTKSFMKPILVPILDIYYYLPGFSGFDKEKIFNNEYNNIVNMDIDDIIKTSELNKLILFNLKDYLLKKKKIPKKEIKENFLINIYFQSDQELAQNLLKISNLLDFGKEEEFSALKEEKSNSNEKNYFLCCLVKTSHHIKGVCFIDDENLNFKVFLNQQTGNAMTGVNIGFFDNDEDYDAERKTCFGSYFMFHNKDKDLYKKSINYKGIVWIFKRRYYYKNSALEIFTTDNKSYYLNFKFEEDREVFLEKITNKIKNLRIIVDDLKESKDPSSIEIGYEITSNAKKKKKNKKKKEDDGKVEKKKPIKLSKKIKEWSEWKMNNFKFLMWINLFGNRSYNDISQYPIFPWILTNFDDPLKIENYFFESSINCKISRKRSSSNLSDLGDSKKKKKKNDDEFNYRDMKLPMGMLEINEESKKRKENFIELYDTIKKDAEEFENTKPYFYGTNYSNPVYVCNFLMRLFPFTHISIELQGNKLDDSNRLFLSVSKSFNNSSTQKTDVRELIPEFFYLPEMFLNINDINLGKQEDDSIVNNVDTPCKNDPFCFIEIMRRIFENYRISYSLHNWIDLIFGYKSKGKDAENAKNIFTEASYQENVILSKIEDKTAYLRYVEFGLIPNQVMNKDCPKRKQKDDVRKGNEITEYNNLNVSKFKISPIKHDKSNEKNNKSINKNLKILKVDILSPEKMIIFFNNNTVIETKIGSSSEDIINTYKINEILTNKISEKLSQKINDKIIKFCNQGSIVLLGGFYDGKIIVVNIEEDNTKVIKTLYPFTEEKPILSLSIDKYEEYLIVGNSIGNVAVYNIKPESNKWDLSYTITDQMSPISYIDNNSELNLFCTATIDGYINLYTLPRCKLVRSIMIPNHNCEYAFLSESSLPSIIVINDTDNKKNLFSYSINGQLLKNEMEEINLKCPMIIKDLFSYEYLAYMVNSNIVIRNLPSLTVQIVINNFSNVNTMCISDDLRNIYGFNEDGTQIQAIRD